jgi:hypothetical protein
MDNAEALRALETIERVMWRAELDSWEEEFSVIRNHLTDPSYVRVPVEPTAEMVRKGHGQWSGESMVEIYKAMLAAATKGNNHD